MPRPSVTRARPYSPKSGALAGRTFHSERQYRNALARLKGFRSWRAQQRAPRQVRSTRELGALRPSERAARDRALEALSLMRREGVSLTHAASLAGTTPNTLFRYAATALRRHRGGRLKARPTDRLFRRMRLLADEGVIDIDVRSSRRATWIGEYWNAVHHFLATGDDSRLRPFAGKSVGAQRFETDADSVELWARRGVLDFEDIYELTT